MIIALAQGSVLTVNFDLVVTFLELCSVDSQNKGYAVRHLVDSADLTYFRVRIPSTRPQKLGCMWT